MEETNVIKGIKASPGISIGKAFVFKEEALSIIPKKIPKESVKKEIARYHAALLSVRNEMLVTKERILKILGKAHTPLADIYIRILADPTLNKNVIRKITEETVNAEYALWSILEKVIQSFEKVDNEYFRDRKNDLQDIGKRIISHLTGEQKRSIDQVGEDEIVVAHNLDLGATVILKQHKAGGFALNVGGGTSHIAIISRGFEIPTVVGLKNITSLANNGDTLIIDGNQGMVIINPDKQTLESYQHEYEIELHERTELEKLHDLPAQTADGHRITLLCNIESVEDLKAVLNSGAEGIGLMRSELAYLNRDNPPTEKELYEIYRTIAQRALPHTIAIRTIDLGGDKLAQFDNKNIVSESSSFLGLRSIRFCLKHPEIFKIQLRAILRASAAGKIRIMFPMISGIAEFRQAKNIVEEIKSELKAKGEEFDENIEIGAMIEVPSAALTADIIAREADFLSIGTNDLIQYTLAVDRMDETVAFMSEPMHLSILRLIKHIIKSGHDAGKPVGMCGEMAADPTFTVVLLGMGLNEFSMVPAVIPNIKKIIRSISMTEAKNLEKEILGANDRDSAVKIFKKHQQKFSEL
jgi:phosphotransferase system enzyme I (PtsI)